MTVYQMKRANEIENRIIALEKMEDWLADTKNKNTFIIATGCRLDSSIILSEDMRTVLHGMCLGEIAKLRAEFEEL